MSRSSSDWDGSQARRMVLVAEPEPRLRELFRLFLESAGCQVIEARTALETLALAGRARPDAIMLDLWLPSPGAFWALEELRARRDLNRAPIVVTSADCDPEIRHRAERLGADHFLTKPFRPTRLMNLLGRRPQRWLRPASLSRPTGPSAAGNRRRPTGGGILIEFPTGQPVALPPRPAEVVESYVPSDRAPGR